MRKLSAEEETRLAMVSMFVALATALVKSGTLNAFEFDSALEEVRREVSSKDTSPSGTAIALHEAVKLFRLTSQ